MGAQWITLIAVAGPAVQAVRSQFEAWAEAMAHNGNWQHTHQMQEEADRLFGILGEHATAPPVAFYRRYVDPLGFAPFFVMTGLCAECPPTCGSPLEVRLNGTHLFLLPGEALVKIRDQLLAPDNFMDLENTAKGRESRRIERWFRQALVDIVEPVAALEEAAGDSALLVHLETVGTFHDLKSFKKLSQALPAWMAVAKPASS